MSSVLTYLEYCAFFVPQLSVFCAVLCVGLTRQGARNSEPNFQRRRAQIANIYAFSDDLLLKIFYHCQPEVDNRGSMSEVREWANERWWYKLAHVCRRWRCLVHTSASHLCLYLLCTYDTPIADMLTYPSALPLIIDFGDEGRVVTAQDEEGILLALRRRRRVTRIRLWVPAATLRRLLSAMDGEYPVLEDLFIKPLTHDNNVLTLPTSFHGPHLLRWVLIDVSSSIPVFPRPLPIPHKLFTETVGQPARYHGPQLWRALKIFVHILDEDSLLNIFRFYRQVMVDEDESDIARILQCGKWYRERWWYKLAHVCRRWRCLILASASHLELCLVCTPGTPVADMLTNSPPFPLIIDYFHEYDSHGITTEDQERIILALRYSDRVRRIRLKMHLLNLQKLLLGLDKEFPILEYLYIAPLTKPSSGLVLPTTFQAPHLCHLILTDFAFSMTSSLTMTTTGLVTLWLISIRQSEHLHPNDFLQQIAFMPQLETLRITFHSPVPNRDLERQLIHRPVTTRVTLPNLRWLGLRAPSTYMEALLSRMATPILERLETQFFLQLNFSVPHLLEFMGAAENLRFGSARFHFSDSRINVYAYPRDGAPMYSFATDIICGHLDWQVSFAAQISRTLRTVFSVVEHLTFEFWRNPKSPETNNDVDCTQWRELLRSFSNVKILCVNEDFREQISCSLQLDDGESQVELLPKLKELQLPQLRHAGNGFKAFINARQTAGRPVTLVRY